MLLPPTRDGSTERRAFLLGRLGPGATEKVIDPGINVVTDTAVR